MHFVFLTKEINWSAVTAIIAALTFIWTVRYNLKKYKADLISKAQIEQIQRIRDESAIFITKCVLFAEYTPTEKIGRPINPQVKVEKETVMFSAEQGPNEVTKSPYQGVVTDSNIEIVRSELLQSGNRLILYFGPDGDTKEIYDLISEILTIANKTDNLQSSEIKPIAEKLRDKLRNYLDKKWKKVK